MKSNSKPDTKPKNINYKQRAHALSCKLRRRDIRIEELKQKLQEAQQNMEKYELLALHSQKHQTKYRQEINQKKFWRTTAVFFALLWLTTIVLVVIKL